MGFVKEARYFPIFKIWGAFNFAQNWLDLIYVVD